MYKSSSRSRAMASSMSNPRVKALTKSSPFCRAPVSVVIELFEATLADLWREANVGVNNLDEGLTVGIVTGPDTDRGVEGPEDLLDDLL